MAQVDGAVVYVTPDELRSVVDADPGADQRRLRDLVGTLDVRHLQLVVDPVRAQRLLPPAAEA